MPYFQPVNKSGINLDIVGGTKFSRYKDITVEETVNMMVTGNNSGVNLNFRIFSSYCV